MKKSFKLFLSVMMASLLLVATACGNSDQTGGSGDDELLIGLTVGTLSNPFFVAMSKGAEEAAEKFGAKVITESGDYDLAKQTRQIEDFITKGVDLILLNAVDTKGIAAAVQQAKDAGIPVIAVDVAAEGGVDATVTSDNYLAGKQAGEYVVEQLGGKGNVVILDGPPVSAVIERVQGFKDVIKGTDIKVIAEQNAEGSREKAQTLMETILQANGKGSIDAVFGINDPTAIGAMVATEQANREGEMFFVGVDGAPSAVEALNAGGDYAATPAQDPAGMIVKAVEIGIKVLNGEEVDEVILVPVKLITQDNVADYKGW
jgi:ribose transport system substrate-binding protein